MASPLTRRAETLLMVALVSLGWGCRSESPTTLLFAGDMMLGRAVERVARSHDDWAFPFRLVERRLHAADVVFGNLESVAATAGGPVMFRADPRSLEGLRDAGFDVISLANNHTADAGLEALAEAASRLRALGIAVTGLRYPPEGQRPTVVRRGSLEVGFLGYSWSAGDYPLREGQPYIAATRRTDMIADVTRARPEVDYLVVSLHMGVEGARRSSAGQRHKARALIDAGADLVVGHHPHVPQEIERYGRGFIAYSLGDFVFDHPELSVDGALLEVTIEAGRLVRLAWLPTRINSEFQPEVIGERVWSGDALRGPNAALD
jgi:poly-gamma-glutamate synthesis protein (capsule biosynthesis protein)